MRSPLFIPSLALLSVALMAGAPRAHAQDVVPASASVADSTPRLEAPYLGIMADDRLGGGRGVYLINILAGSPAAKAGLTTGDLITAVDGLAIHNRQDISRSLVGQAPGKTISMDVTRQGASRKVEVTLGSRADARPTAASRVKTSAAAPKLGIRAEPATPSMQSQYNLPAGSGVWIASITPGSAADEARLPIGALITAVDSQAVRTPDELGAAIGRAGFGAEIELTYLTQPGQEAQKKKVTLPRQANPQEVASGSQPRAAARPLDTATVDADSAVRIDALERRVKELEAQVDSLESQLRVRGQ